MDSLKPMAMNFEHGNIAENWRKWLQHMKLLLTGPLADKPTEQQCSYFLLYIGQAGRDIYNTWTLTQEEENNVEVLMEKFSLYCKPKRNVTMARYKFNSRVQGIEEGIDQFVTELRLFANDCEFGDLTNSLIRDRIIFGTNEEKVRERLLQEEDIALDKAIDIARSIEASKRQLSNLAGGASVDIKTVKKSFNQHGPHIPKSSKAKQQPYHARQQQQSQHTCANCGLSPHPFSKCPARNKVCNYCKKLNHYSKMCRKLNFNKSKQTKNVYELSEELETVSFEQIAINTIGNQQNRDEAYADLKVTLPSFKDKNTTLKVKVDTGAQGNALPIRLYKSMFPNDLDEKGNPASLTPSHKILTSYGGHKIRQYGVCSISCTYKNIKHQATFYVTEDEGSAIIGLPSAEALNLVTLNCEIKGDNNHKREIIQKYPDTFNGVGKFEGQYHIHLDSSVPPVVHAPRKVPISLKERIKMELDEMEKMDIIKKVEEGEPTAWVNSLVYREKPNGRLRLCLDPKDLNKAIRREHHITPTLEEILPQLSGAKYFSILDAKCGYWNVELDNESSYLTTFNSPFGRYRFTRMPFGLSMSQDIFQVKIDQTFEGCPGTIGIADDIVVFGKDEAEHDKNLKLMIEKCVEKGLKLNPEKCKIKQNEIKFYGVICSENGVKPDPAKVSALKNMKPPENPQELQSFLGLTTYMSTFIQNTSELTSPLREMLKKENHFEWNASHDSAFNKIKDAISDKVTLAYFDGAKPITVQVDASMKGLGATLMQDGQPVAFASKALTDEETRYANIERELLAVVYGCERFHTYLYGQTFTVESDHKPLESIQLKHLKAAPPRLQRMLLRIQPYNLKIKYIPGKEMKIADTLSRLSPEKIDKIKDLDVQIHSIFTEFSQNILQRIRQETMKDVELNALKDIVYTGWPEKIQNTTQLCKPYWNYRDEIGLEEGILMKSRRIMIPKSMQKEILQKLHEPHLGIEKTLLRARTAVFWRNINRDIEDITKQCQTCQAHQPTQRKEPLITTEIPPNAWHTIGTDLFYIKGEEYLLIADYYTKFQFVRKIPQGQSTSHKIVTLTKQIISEQGIPDVIRSDNGPHFSGNAYKEFVRAFGIKHETSSPHYPRSNGFIESQVKIVKRTLQKAFETSTDPYLALLALRTTPINNNIASPAELLLGRTIKDGLPRKPLKSSFTAETIANLENRQKMQEQHYNKTTRPLPPLSAGQPITYQNKSTNKWEPGVVTQRNEYPRSYQIRTQRGQEIRRNRHHLRPVPKQWPMSETIPMSDYDDHDVQKATNAQGKLPCLPVPEQIEHERSSVRGDSPSPQEHLPQTNKAHYITRSGRTVRTPQIYNC